MTNSINSTHNVCVCACMNVCVARPGFAPICHCSFVPICKESSAMYQTGDMNHVNIEVLSVCQLLDYTPKLWQKELL